MFIGECHVNETRDSGARCVPAGNHRPAAGRADLEAVMKLKISELTGDALDWVVTKLEAERGRFTIYPEYITSYSTNWLVGGPIIEREGIALHPLRDYEVNGWAAGPRPVEMYGPTPLVAAMRFYVMLISPNTEVDVPEELSPPQINRSL